MINKKILLLSTYPIVLPRDGGQKRVTAIVEEYKKVFQEVKHVAVFKGRYPSYSKDDIYVKSNGDVDPGLIPLIGDIVAGEAIFADAQIKNKISKLLKNYRPDIIEVEQVFPYFGLKPLLQEMGISPKIVFNSQNIENSMKAEILKAVNIGPDLYKPISEKIRQTEEALCREADLTIAVSESDAKVLEQMGAKKVILAPNGIAKELSGQAAVDYWQKYMDKQAVKHLVTFIGSAHPPNWFGFLATIGDRIGFIPPDTKLVLAGSISDYFVEHINQQTPEQVTFWQRVVATGRLTEDRLAGLIQASNIILLPITEGGGSNLKTAEAILSGRKIVATSYAFRSFEQYLKLPNIYIADTPEEFRTTIVKALQEFLKPLTDSQKQLSEKVQWKYCLQDAVKAVGQL